MGQVEVEHFASNSLKQEKVLPLLSLASIYHFKPANEAVLSEPARPDMCLCVCVCSVFCSGELWLSYC